MKIAGAINIALVLYREKFIKFNNKHLGEGKKMIFNWFEGKGITKRDPKNPILHKKTLLNPERFDTNFYR